MNISDTSRRAPHPSSGRLTTALAIIAAAALTLSACVPPTALRGGRVMPDEDDTTTVLLIKPDIELSELTAGGLNEAHAEWTEAGLGNVEQALADFMSGHKAATVPYQPPDDDPREQHTHQQLLKLHRTVGVSILLHMYSPAGGSALPTKEPGVLDWSLGPGAVRLGADTGADYALFVYLRDSYATAGRQVMIAAAALLGAYMPGGVQGGFASLVDLRSGDVVWFNRLVRTTGDLRTPGPARESVELLLTGIPL